MLRGILLSADVRCARNRPILRTRSLSMLLALKCVGGIGQAGRGSQQLGLVALNCRDIRKIEKIPCQGADFHHLDAIVVFHRLACPHVTANTARRWAARIVGIFP